MTFQGFMDDVHLAWPWCLNRSERLNFPWWIWPTSLIIHVSMTLPTDFLSRLGPTYAVKITRTSSINADWGFLSSTWNLPSSNPSTTATPFMHGLRSPILGTRRLRGGIVSRINTANPFGTQPKPRCVLIWTPWTLNGFQTTFAKGFSPILKERKPRERRCALPGSTR